MAGVEWGVEEGRMEVGGWREKLMAQTRWGEQGMRSNAFWISLKAEPTGFAVAMR